ncbi:hypothetical protein C7C46_21950 [Streptomyces tateyamensis]|uniref:DUF2306 domain-containing protein n=2 Tax=Streptomyces tateyamensis TaxID=565073 RepID=A0A2V4P1S7_9ACTN|nr:hypothetical protein C7C46_21950 [Streptomyces tateyamensis]
MAVFSLAVTGYFVGQYATAGLQTLGAQHVGLASNYAQRALPIQLAFYLHIVFAGVALSVGPFQFVRAIRRRWPTLHRWIGRTYVLAIAVGSVAAFVMSFVSQAGLVGLFGFGSLAVLWAWTTYRGYRAIRGRDVAEHRAWMIRSFALTFAAPTLRLWLGLLIGAQALVGSHATDQQMFDNAYAAVPFLCWLPNIVVAELMIRRRNLPGLRFSSGAGQVRSQVRATPVPE